MFCKHEPMPTIVQCNFVKTGIFNFTQKGSRTFSLQDNY